MNQAVLFYYRLLAAGALLSSAVQVLFFSEQAWPLFFLGALLAVFMLTGKITYYLLAWVGLGLVQALVIALAPAVDYAKFIQLLAPPVLLFSAFRAQFGEPDKYYGIRTRWSMASTSNWQHIHRVFWPYVLAGHALLSSLVLWLPGMVLVWVILGLIMALIMSSEAYQRRVKRGKFV